MKHPLFLIAGVALLLAVACNNMGGSGNRIATADSARAPYTDAADLPLPAPPEGYTLLAQATGDLDRDGKPELAAAYTTPERGENGLLRKLLIYKSGTSAWTPWHESAGPLMPSEGGGQFSDPFQSLEIDDGSIVINHAGGSRERWDYVHRYRLNGSRWELIGATVTTGEPCDTITSFDYNLTTGEIELERESDDCDETGTEVPGQGKDETFRFRISIAPVPMDGFRPGENPAQLPQQGEFYY